MKGPSATIQASFENCAENGKNRDAESIDRTHLGRALAILPAMKKSWLACSLALLTAAACASGPSTTSETPDATAPREATAAETPPAEGTAAPISTSTAAASEASAPGNSAGPAKDADALVMEVVFIEKGGKKVDEATLGELMKSFEARVGTSLKLATPASKGVTAPRRVTATFMVEAPITDAKGLTIKMGLNGVEPAGKCPLFDLDQKLTMSGGKNTPADVLELRKAAVVALLEKLEPTAPTLKPAANCTAFKK